MSGAGHEGPSWLREHSRDTVPPGLGYDQAHRGVDHHDAEEPLLGAYHRDGIQSVVGNAVRDHQRWLERTRGQEIGVHDLLDGRRLVREVQVAQRDHAAQAARVFFVVQEIDEIDEAWIAELVLDMGIHFGNGATRERGHYLIGHYPARG